MSRDEKQAIQIADSRSASWEEHPRIKNIWMKPLLTADDNKLASVNIVKIPVGGAVPRHLHEKEVETVYMLQGQGRLVLGQEERNFEQGQVVAIPMNLEHALINKGSEPIEIITFFTPPL